MPKAVPERVQSSEAPQKQAPAAKGIAHALDQPQQHNSTTLLSDH
jgi:hypothetical protein